VAEPFKNLIHPALLATTARELLRAWRPFPTERFLELAGNGLERLELKRRVLQVASALAATLPSDFGAAADVLEATLAPASNDTAIAKLQPGPNGLAGWIVWPFTEFVAARGLDHPERALRALHAMTQRLTAEYAIRPFLVRHEALTLRTLRRWLADPSVHVRRLCSEGSRPRLPWGIRLQRFCQDPSPTLPLLTALQDDPSDYVRRSVANHLNDIAKDNPNVVVAWLAQHLPDAPKSRLQLLRHAARTLVKQGHPGALRAFGLGQSLRGEATFAIVPKAERIGGAVELQVTLRSTAKRSQALVVDYVVHRPTQRGTSAKVWKGWQLELAAGGQLALQKRHSLAKVTTRQDRPGRHAVDLVINGKVVASAAFELRR
jgi:3-methyladenine DNA glycosylase AlkC